MTDKTNPHAAFFERYDQYLAEHDCGPYSINSDTIDIVEDWIQDFTGETRAMKHQTWLIIQELRRQLAETTEQVAEIVEFLQTLTTPHPVKTISERKAAELLAKLDGSEK